jgi:hypothetical protein
MTDSETAPGAEIDALADAFFAGDVAAIDALLAPGASFHSPAADYHDRAQIVGILTALGEVATQRQRLSTLRADGQLAARFTAQVAGRDADGVLLVNADADGRPASLTLLLRPLETLIAGVRLMRVALGLPEAR